MIKLFLTIASLMFTNEFVHADSDAGSIYDMESIMSDSGGAPSTEGRTKDKRRRGAGAAGESAQVSQQNPFSGKVLDSAESRRTRGGSAETQRKATEINQSFRKNISDKLNVGHVTQVKETEIAPAPKRKPKPKAYYDSLVKTWASLGKKDGDRKKYIYGRLDAVHKAEVRAISQKRHDPKRMFDAKGKLAKKKRVQELLTAQQELAKIKNEPAFDKYIKDGTLEKYVNPVLADAKKRLDSIEAGVNYVNKNKSRDFTSDEKAFNANSAKVKWDMMYIKDPVLAKYKNLGEKSLTSIEKSWMIGQLGSTAISKYSPEVPSVPLHKTDKNADGLSDRRVECFQLRAGIDDVVRRLDLAGSKEDVNSIIKEFQEKMEHATGQDHTELFDHLKLHGKNGADTTKSVLQEIQKQMPESFKSTRENILAKDVQTPGSAGEHLVLSCFASSKTKNNDSEYFGNYSINDQNIILEALKVMYNKADSSGKDAIALKLNNQIALLADDGTPGYHTISAGLLDKLNTATTVEEKIDILLGANRYKGDYFDCKGEQLLAKSPDYIYFSHTDDIELANALQSIVDNSADVNAKLYLFKVFEQMLIRAHREGEVAGLRKAFYEKLAQKELKDCEALKNKCSPDEIKELRGLGLSAFLESLAKVTEGDATKDNISSERLAKLMGLSDKKVTFKELQEYVDKLHSQRNIAMEYGHDIDYDSIFKIVAEEVSQQYVALGLDEKILLDNVALQVSYRNLNIEGFLGTGVDKHNNVSSFLAASEHLLDGNGTNDAATFLNNALKTEDPQIVLFALSLMHDKVLSAAFEDKTPKEIIDLVEKIKAYEPGSTEAKEFCEEIANRGEKFSPQFHDDILTNKYDVTEMVRETEGEYHHEAVVNGPAMEAFRTSARKKSAKDDD